MFTTATSIAIALLVGIGVASWQAIRATAAEQLASAEQENSQRNLEAAMDAIEQLLVHVGNPELANVPAVQSIRAKILRDSLDFYDRFAKQSGRSERTDYRAAKVFKELGTLARESEQFPETATAYSKALALADALVLGAPRRVDYLGFQAEMNDAICSHFMNPKVGPDASDQAIAYAKTAEQQFKSLTQMEPANKDYRFSRAVCLRKLAALYHRKDANDPRVPLVAEQAYQLTEQSFADPPLLRLLGWINEEKSPTLAESYYRQALDAAREKSHDAREDRYRHAWLCTVAAPYLSTRNVDEAESLYKEAADILVELASDFPEQEQYRERLVAAATEYIRILDAEGRSAEALLQLDAWSDRYPLHAVRALHFAKGDTELSIQALTEAMKEYPREFTYLLERATLYVRLGAIDQALADLNHAVQLSGPTNPAPYLSRAEFYSSTQQYTKAIADYDVVLDLNARGHIYKRRAFPHFRLKHFEKCIADMTQSVTYNPNDMSNLTWIPTAEVAACPNAFFREAFLQLVDRTVDVNGRSADALVTRAAIQCAFGQWDKARRDLAELIAGKEVQAYTLYQAGLLALTTGDIGEYHAICQRQAVSFTEADDALSQHFAAWTCALSPNATNDYAAAIEHAQNAVAADGTDQQYRLGLGAILMRAGQLEEAKVQLEKTLQAASSDKSSTAYAYYFLALTEHQLTHINESKQHLQSANKLAEKELADSPAWNRKLTLELLRREAESALDGAKQLPTADE